MGATWRQHKEKRPRKDEDEDKQEAVLYDIVTSSEFAAGVDGTVGDQIQRCILANLHVFSAKQQKILQSFSFKSSRGSTVGSELDSRDGHGTADRRGAKRRNNSPSRGSACESSDDRRDIRWRHPSVSRGSACESRSPSQDRLRGRVQRRTGQLGGRGRDDVHGYAKRSRSD